MRSIICITAALALCAGTTPLYAKTAKHTAFQLNESSWTFTDKKGVKMRESVDASGNYILNTAAGKHLDHGTTVMKDSKACFTSAMTKDGENCWTTARRALAIGHSFVTTSDKGEKLRVTRVKYSPLKMPS
jgi:hypothetical protein